MKKSSLFIYVLIVITLSLYFGRSIFSIQNTIDKNDEILALETFDYEGEKIFFTERKVNESKVHEYHTLIKENDLPKVGNHLTLIVTRLRGNWHEIYFNNILVGEIGSKYHDSNHVWNDIYIFSIDKNLVMEENEMKFLTSSDHKIGFGPVPVIITSQEEGHSIYKRMRGVYSRFYFTAISAIAAISLLVVGLFVSTKSFAKSYGLMPFGTLAISLYLLDYTNISYAPLSPFVFKKIIIILLYTAVLFQSISLARIYKQKWLFKLGLVSYILSSLGFIIAWNTVVLSDIYEYTNLLVMLNILCWLVILIRHTIKEQTSENWMLLLATLLLLLPSALDVFILLTERGRNLRLSVYGIIFYSVAILMLTILKYIDEQKEVYHQSEKLIQDKKRLETALITDELTGLRNRRALFELESLSYFESTSFIYFDIDKFNALTNTFGHSVGDEIIKIITEVIQEAFPEEKIFRYGYSKFVIIIHDKKEKEVKSIAEDVRKAIMKDEQIDELSGYYPVTISGGIANYPKDGVDLKGVIRKAEKAREYARIIGHNRVCTYQRGMETQLESQAQQKLKYDLLNDFVMTLAGAIDLKDMYTGKHSEQVCRYASLIAEAMNLEEDLKRPLRMGSLLHDLGKIAIPDEILMKENKLTDEEYEQIKTHTVLGSKLIEGIMEDHLVIACVRHHHERYDGKGYPDGLKGDMIPLVARIVCVADAYHSMISNRPYRKGMTKESAISQLEGGLGTQFDPEIAQIFIDELRRL